MNFKISFKTWLKKAKSNLKMIERQRREADGLSIGESTLGDEKQTICFVEIDVEVYFETTSDEDDDDLA